MKRAILILSLLAMTGICMAIEMPESAKAMRCQNCHAIDHRIIGPALMDVSRRYRHNRDDQAFFDQMVERVSKGGHGNWGDLPMVPNDPTGRKRDKVVALVKFVLSLSDQLPENQKK